MIKGQAEDETFFNGTLLGYDVWLWGSHFRIPIRNKRRTELREEVDRMLLHPDKKHIKQQLGAMFSWLETWEEVAQFEKDYSIVDRKIVQDLVAKFVAK